jgi:DNA polymerase-3 subunit chi
MPAACNFYMLKNARLDGRFLFACALIEKLYARGHQVYIHCQHAEEAARFNELLWTYKDTSFIPHGLSGEHSLEDCPIQIGFREPSEPFNDVLIFLSAIPDVPNFYTNFSRIVEIVDSESTIKEVLRKHYQYYRSQGLDVKTHEV